MKKLLFVFMAIFMVLTGGAVVKADIASERSWYFKDEEFSELHYGTITSAVTVNGLTIGNGSEVNESKGPVKVFYFNKSIYTMANGSISSGFIKFSVSGDTDIHILGVSKSNTHDRILNIYTTADGVLGNVTITPKTEDYVYKYRGKAGDVYLYTSGNGVRIYGITAKSYSADLGEYAPLGENQKKVWDIENYEKYTGNITQNLNLDGMEIKATEAYPVKIEENTNNYASSGYHKYRYLNLVGVPKGDNRQISFAVNKNSDVYITARSSDGESARNLVIWNQYYGTPKTSIDKDTISVDNSIKTYKISYYGDGEIFNICSQDSGIKIFKISVVPRLNKVIDYKKWDINSNSGFTTGSYADRTTDGLNIINAAVENSTATGNQKAIHMLSGIYGSKSKIKFNISDSSQSRGAAIKRTITIKAKSAYDDKMKLVLISSDDYIIGSTDLTTEIAEYKFDYTGTYDSIYVYCYCLGNMSSKGAYIYSIDNGKKAADCPEDSKRTISVTKGQKYQYYFTAGNIDADAFTYKISYNKDALTPKYIGYGDGTDSYSTDGINIIKNANGEIIYTIENTNSNWSGVTVSVIFEAKSSGNTTIGYIAEPIL
ncbi:MAG: hypothetical protein Q4D26_08430 [Clostridia bacterium]|nr:hypothetical protein [Clostridia bacterium]